jgi:hypothetical protein
MFTLNDRISKRFLTKHKIKVVRRAIEVLFDDGELIGSAAIFEENGWYRIYGELSLGDEWDGGWSFHVFRKQGEETSAIERLVIRRDSVKIHPN